MQEIISRRMSDRVLLCIGDLQLQLLSKKSSWRAVVGMRWLEIIYQEVNKNRLADHFNKIPGEREKEGTYNRFAN